MRIFASDLALCDTRNKMITKRKATNTTRTMSPLLTEGHEMQFPLQFTADGRHLPHNTFVGLGSLLTEQTSAVALLTSTPCKIATLLTMRGLIGHSCDVFGSHLTSNCEWNACVSNGM